MSAVLKKNKKIILFFIFCYIMIFCFNFFKNIDLDILWNYGFSKNVSDGLIMYKDFNMVITPLYPLLTGLFMKIFGTNMIIFYLINTFYALFILVIVYKLYKKIIFPFFIYFLFESAPGYNTLSILYVFLLIYLEHLKKLINILIVSFLSP